MLIPRCPDANTRAGMDAKRCSKRGRACGGGVVDSARKVKNGGRLSCQGLGFVCLANQARSHSGGNDSRRLPLHQEWGSGCVQLIGLIIDYYSIVPEKTRELLTWASV